MIRTLENMLYENFDSVEIFAALDENPALFDQLVEITVSGKHSKSWRAPWVISNLMSDNDARLRPFIKNLINALDGKKDGYQRELLKIIQRMDIPDELEGILFDKCTGIWEVTKKSPSARIAAFKILIDTANKHPELKKDIQFLTEQHYTQTLSPGIKRSLKKMMKEL